MKFVMGTLLFWAAFVEKICTLDAISPRRIRYIVYGKYVCVFFFSMYTRSNNSDCGIFCVVCTTLELQYWFGGVSVYRF